MHIIYFDRHDKRHTFNITKTYKLLFGFLFISLILGFGFYGYYLGKNKNLDLRAQSKWVDSWESELDNQTQYIENAKTDAKMHLDAFSEQMAKLQAHVARLDALGIHLSRLAKVDSDLFNFSENLSEQDLHDSDSDNNTVNNDATLGFFKMYDDLSNNITTLDNQLNLLQSVLKYQKLDRQTLVKGKPIKNGYISSYYGYRNHPIKKRRILHRGIDFVSKKNTPILAVASGVVSWAGPRGGYGNLVEINHGDGYSTRYAHNDSLLVSVGDLINKGDEIAKMGSTGKSTGTHVHFEVWRNGKSENPIRYLSRK